MSSREKILNKLRAVQRPFPDAPPRPTDYLPVTLIDDTSPDALLARFTAELERLRGQVCVVDGDDAARDMVLELLRGHKAEHILAWDFAHIPVAGLRDAIMEAGICITHPDLHDKAVRPEVAASIKGAQAGLIGVDAAAATTGTLIVSTGPGKGRTPTVLPPALIAVVAFEQLIPRIEDWVARERANGLPTITGSANVCFITGPSRTGDIEMQLVLGVHGPGIVQVIVKR
jgi:L-lactate utilization protein LutC